MDGHPQRADAKTIAESAINQTAEPQCRLPNALRRLSYHTAYQRATALHLKQDFVSSLLGAPYQITATDSGADAESDNYRLSAFRNQGLGCGVGRALGIGVGRGVAVGVGVAVAVAVGVGVAVAVGVGVGDGAGTSPGAWITTSIGEPVLKKPTVASVGFGGWSASNRKLYSVPKRIALAF